jgi:hypothetical protein
MIPPAQLSPQAAGRKSLVQLLRPTDEYQPCGERLFNDFMDQLNDPERCWYEDVASVVSYTGQRFFH